MSRNDDPRETRCWARYETEHATGIRCDVTGEHDAHTYLGVQFDPTNEPPDQCTHHDLITLTADTGRRKCYDCGTVLPQPHTEDMVEPMIGRVTAADMALAVAATNFVSGPDASISLEDEPDTEDIPEAVYLDAAREHIKQWMSHEALTLTGYEEHDAQHLAQQVGFRAGVAYARRSARALPHPDLEAAQAEIAELLTELDGRDQDARERWIERQMAETTMRSIDFRNGMNMEIGAAREMTAHFVAAARAMLGDATNYTETKISFDVKVAESPEMYTLVVQRHGPGILTPHDARLKAEADLAAARAEVETLTAANARLTAENNWARMALNVAKNALEQAPGACRYHGTEFDKLGMERGEPRCDSCKQPYRVAKALEGIKAVQNG